MWRQFCYAVFGEQEQLGSQAVIYHHRDYRLQYWSAVRYASRIDIIQSYEDCIDCMLLWKFWDLLEAGATSAMHTKCKQFWILRLAFFPNAGTRCHVHWFIWPVIKNVRTDAMARSWLAIVCNIPIFPGSGVVNLIKHLKSLINLLLCPEIALQFIMSQSDKTLIGKIMNCQVFSFVLQRDFQRVEV